MNKDEPGDLMKSHAELCIVRLLVESVVMTLNQQAQARVAVKYEAACERLLADVLASQQPEALVNAIQRAIAEQDRRLSSLGVPTKEALLPSGQGQQRHRSRRS